MTAPRLSVFDKDGFYIGDLRAAPTYEYILNASPSPGRCEFSVSRNDAKNTLKYLEFGKYILLRHKWLPDWIGEIVQRSWNFGNMDILAFQAEYILSKRDTPVQKYTGSAGAIFSNILTYTNNQLYNEKVIMPTNIFSGGIQREETLGNNALSHVGAIANRSGNDFDVKYTFDTNGKLYLTGNWYQQKGQVSNKYLIEGRNILLANNVLVEDGRELANWVEGRGDASTSETRLSSVQFNIASIARYGLNQMSSVFEGNKQQATLDDNTLNKLLTTLDPASSYDLTVLDVADSAGISVFKFLDTGNVHNLDLNTAGFNPNGGFGTQAQVRTVGMSYNSLDNRCRLVVKKYVPLTA